MSPEEQPTEEIDVEAVALSRHDEKLRRYALFDKLVDCALDGQVDLGEAIESYKEEVYGQRDDSRQHSNGSGQK